MVSGKPPRRSKTPGNPVTIDLQAEESPAVPVPAEPANEPVTTSPAEADEAALQTSADAETTETTAADKAPDDAAHDQANTSTEDSSVEQALREGSADTTTEAPNSSQRDEMNGKPDGADPAAAARPAPATSTLIASGILGGLVALALAGSMQYAGVLPTIGPDNDTPAQSSISAEELEMLKTEVARLATTAATPATAPVDPALAERMTAIEEALASSANQQPAPADTAALDDVRTQLAAASQAIDALKSEIEANRQTLAQSSTRLADAERRLDEPRNDVAMARAIALAGLKTAIDRGGPFLSELDALKSVSPDDPAVAALTATATTGVLSRSDLARDFPDVADSILAAVNAPAAGEGWSDRLLSSARSLVKVRPIGNVEGETPEAIVARIENKLQNGDLKGAHLEWQALPDVAKAASQDFAEKLDTRIKAEQVVGEALARTVAGNEG